MYDADYRRRIEDILRQLQNAIDATNAAKQTLSKLMDECPNSPMYVRLYSSIGTSANQLYDAHEVAKKIS